MKKISSWMDQWFPRLGVWGLGMILVCLSAPAHANVDAGWNVVLLTLDGVRAEEFFHGVRFPRRTDESGPAFPRFWEKTADHAWIYGHDDARMRISNPYAMSLPGYQSIFTGRSQGKRCRDNGRRCQSLVETTFLERIKNEWNLERSQVAVVASWTEYRRAVEKESGSIFVNVGQDAMIDPDAPAQVPETLIRLNQAQKNHLAPWAPTRSDRYTFEYALWYLKQKQPRVLVIGLNDADELAHHGRYDAYFKTLRRYDEWMDRLRTTLAELGEYGRKTALVVTTDHGRGRGVFWSQHAQVLAASAWVWAFVVPPEELTARVQSRVSGAFAHNDIRPTVETLLGLSPSEGPGRSWIKSVDSIDF